ncbi:MAG: divergent polysaccharide deacetylase family protein [Wenzhouxiangella sp.]|jgi:polysaccharide deacetylase 2 family uncharacterized protein YibQ|nr:divergent polysaccharide deacetylase family protein [Wenzhouxiangella sp.]
MSQARKQGPLIGLAALLMLMASSLAAEPARIAIIIDDLGYRTDMDHAVLALDPRIAVAVIPDAPGAASAALTAANQSREVLIHLPLIHLQGDCDNLVCLGQNWSVDEIYRHLKWADQRVPGAVGLSNHQGSSFTADPMASRRLVDGLLRLKTDDDRQLFVIDSRTSPNSQLAGMAYGAGLSYAERQVFLDHDRRPGALEEAWQELLERARRDGQALAIGHPHPETIAYLRAVIPSLGESNVRLVKVSRLLTSAGSVAAQQSMAGESPLTSQ